MLGKLAAVQAQVLTVHGDQDEIVPYTDAQAQVGVLPREQFCLGTLQGCGHFFKGFEKDLVAVVTDWLLPRLERIEEEEEEKSEARGAAIHGVQGVKEEDSAQQ